MPPLFLSSYLTTCNITFSLHSTLPTRSISWLPQNRWGSIGVTEVIPDDEWPCTDCCPLRRSYPNGSSTNMCTAAAKQAAMKTWDNQDQMAPVYGSNAESTAGGGLCSSRASPCVFNVVTDVTESTNLFGNPTYNATVAHLLARVDFHLGR